VFTQTIPDALKLSFYYFWKIKMDL